MKKSTTAVQTNTNVQKETMTLSKHLSELIAHCKKTLHEAAGFTMIELLIVISILGILAVAVLAAINPVEQINRGRDTGTRSDAEQLLSALDRFNAFQGYYAWMTDADDATTDVGVVEIDTDGPEAEGVTGCHILERLSSGDTMAGCTGTDELKDTFVDRMLNDPSSRALYIYNSGAPGASTYVCFIPQSGAFSTEAQDRCDQGFPVDATDLQTDACDPDAGEIQGEGPAICLP